MSTSSKKRRSDTRDPRRSRARALKLLYQADVRGEDPVALLDKVAADGRAASLLDDLDPDEAADLSSALPADHPDADPEHARLAAARTRNVAPIDGFTRSLVTGVAERRDELDALVQRFARRWALARMPAVDRNALRLGAYELQHESTSPAVVINEMVELAKGLSTDDSGRYVNGVLEAIRKELAAAPPAAAAPASAPTEGPATTEVPATTAEATAEPEPPVAPPVPDPVALPDDVELIEASTPPTSPQDEPSGEVAAPRDDVDVEPDDADDEDDEATADPVDELRQDHGHVADRDDADEDVAQQQLF